MNVHRYITSALLCATLLANAQYRDFKYRRAIGHVDSADWYNITLPLNIFQHTKNDLSDIRILSLTETDTVEVPYLLKVKTDFVSEGEVDLEVRNLSRSGNKLFFQVNVPEGKTINTLHLDFNERNFNGHVTLEGSDDRRTWYEIGKRMRILSILNNTIDFQSTTLEFPPSMYPYLRISIEADVPLILRTAKFRNVTTKNGIYHEVPSDWSVDYEQKNTTIIRIRPIFPVPVSRLHIQAEHPTDYYRRYTIAYSADSVQTEKGWVQNYVVLQSGYLTSLKADVLEFRNVLVNELRVTIHNLNDPAISIRDVSLLSPETELIARLSPADLFLYYGHPSVQKPAYDIIHFEDRVPEKRLLATLGDEEDVGLRVRKSPLFSDRLWLWGMMAVVIGILGYFTFRMLSGSKS